MSTESRIWTVVLLVGLAALGARALAMPMGRVYVKPVEHRFVKVVKVVGAVPPNTPETVIRWEPLKPGEVPPREAVVRSWTTYEEVKPREARGGPHVPPSELVSNAQFSWSRTLAVWIAAAMTLCAVSFLWGDNVMFKLMQSIIVGVTAGYGLVVYFWSQLVPNLFGNLMPDLVRATFVPGLEAGKTPDWTMLVPLVLGLMMLCRLLPAGGWISRWPLAFFIGLLAGVNLVNIFKSDFLEQVKNTILPLAVFTDRGFDLAQSLKNLGLVLGVMSSLVYFFFSVEHRGAVGRVARVGVWVLMITFGASFGLTVMTRITIFSSRLQFLFDDWLWLIDPLGRR